MAADREERSTIWLERYRGEMPGQLELFSEFWYRRSIGGEW